MDIVLAYSNWKKIHSFRCTLSILKPFCCGEVSLNPKVWTILKPSISGEVMQICTYACIHIYVNIYLFISGAVQQREDG